MEILRNELNNLQHKTIGIFAQLGYNELVIDEDECSFTTIYLGSLGAFQTNHYPKSKFIFAKIPEKYGTLGKLLDEPFEFNEWYKLNDLTKK